MRQQEGESVKQTKVQVVNRQFPGFPGSQCQVLQQLGRRRITSFHFLERKLYSTMSSHNSPRTPPPQKQEWFPARMAFNVSPPGLPSTGTLPSPAFSLKSNPSANFSTPLARPFPGEKSSSNIQPPLNLSRTLNKRRNTEVPFRIKRRSLDEFQKSAFTSCTLFVNVFSKV